MLDYQQLTTKRKKLYFFLAQVALICDSVCMNKILQRALDRIEQLEQIIDRETTDADAGCDWSKSQVINAEEEKRELQIQIKTLALFHGLTR